MLLDVFWWLSVLSLVTWRVRSGVTTAKRPATEDLDARFCHSQFVYSRKTSNICCKYTFKLQQ